MSAPVPLVVPGIPGGPEVLVILLIIVLLFGANKIPKLARSSGQAIGEFQKGREEVEEELQEMKEDTLDGSSDSGATDAGSESADAASTDTTATETTETSTEETSSGS